MAAEISIKDIPDAVRRKMGVRRPRTKGMSLHDVRTLAFRVMNVLAELTPTERARVLRQAQKLNEV